MALSFAVSPRGGDHLKGLSLYEVASDLYATNQKKERESKSHLRYWLQSKTKAELMKWHENWHCVVDSLGLCKLEGISVKPLLPKHFQRMIVAATGWGVSLQDLDRIGERIWNIERLFNVREGKRKADDYPPNRLLEEPISSGPAQGERLDREKFEHMLGTYLPTAAAGIVKRGFPRR